MKHIYGTIIPNLMIEGKPAPYPVVNERSIRAAAGIMFAIGVITFCYIRFTQHMWPLYVVVPLFWFDFLLKTIVDPKYSIFGWIGSLLVKKQKPEYVGAIQKRFAWAIGLGMSSLMMILVLGFGVRGTIPFVICGICLVFMWLESAAGICVGCTIYAYILKKNILKAPDVLPACPGGVCSIKK